MSNYQTFVEKWNALGKLLREKPYSPIPDKFWEKPARELEKIVKAITSYYSEPRPGPSDVKAVKGHEITAQIKAFINKDKERKAFFTLDYFKAKCAALPDRGLIQELQKGATRDAYLTAFLVYHYWKARPDQQRGLTLARKDVETDYQNSPAARDAEQARALFRDLLVESDLNRIVKVVEAKFSDKASVDAFAKAVGLKIAAGKKPIHERLAAKILKAGELVRAKF